MHVRVVVPLMHYVSTCASPVLRVQEYAESWLLRRKTTNCCEYFGLMFFSTTRLRVCGYGSRTKCGYVCKLTEDMMLITQIYRTLLLLHSARHEAICTRTA